MEKQYFYNTPSARMLEFDRIIGRLEEMAYTEKAKEMIRELAPGLSEAEVKAQLKNTTEARTMLENCGMPPITALEGITELLEMAGKGICLTAEQLEKIASTLTAVKRLKYYLCRGMSYDISLPYFVENLDSLEEIREELY